MIRNTAAKKFTQRQARVMDAALRFLHQGHIVGSAMWAAMNRPGFYDLPDCAEVGHESKLNVIMRTAVREALAEANHVIPRRTRAKRNR